MSSWRDPWSSTMPRKLRVSCQCLSHLHDLDHVQVEFIIGPRRVDRLDGANDVLGELVGLLERKLRPQGGLRQKVYLLVRVGLNRHFEIFEELARLVLCHVDALNEQPRMDPRL